MQVRAERKSSTVARATIRSWVVGVKRTVSVAKVATTSSTEAAGATTG
jgi:hypothetical protein